MKNDQLQKDPFSPTDSSKSRQTKHKHKHATNRFDVTHTMDRLKDSFVGYDFGSHQNNRRSRSLDLTDSLPIHGVYKSEEPEPVGEGEGEFERFEDDAGSFIRYASIGGNVAKNKQFQDSFPNQSNNTSPDLDPNLNSHIDHRRDPLKSHFDMDPGTDNGHYGEENNHEYCNDKLVSNGNVKDYEIGLHYQHYTYLRQSEHVHGHKAPSKNQSCCSQNPCHFCIQAIFNALHQLPAVALIAMFHLMVGVPFGVSYFPIGWREASSTPFSSEEDPNTNTNTNSNSDNMDMNVHGTFPIAGKDALGIRMFLFSTLIGQLAFTFTSGFGNPISIQMIENVPFCQTLAQIVISHAGYGMEALSTIMVMFGLSSVVVGLVFYTLGKMKWGRVVYFFPTHVLVGCIGGIGLFIVKTGVEVTINRKFSFEEFIRDEGSCLSLLGVVLAFEGLLRGLEWVNRRIGHDGKPKYSLLSPIYFCMITPAFYGILRLVGVSVQKAMDMGYFFPSLVGSGGTGGIFTKDLLDMWRVIDFSNISWPAIIESIPTLIALSLFSLIHVPINIPAFSISTNQEADMNKELISHGYSNIFAGMCGGLQNYMAYTQSVLYARSGGWGKPSGVAVSVATSALFLIGPTIASYVPRCMAGTLLLHVGIDLFLEGVYDTYGKFEKLEYMGTWLITIVMTVYGMNAAMIAGGISAVSTYAVQTVAYLHPIRGTMTAATLRSSKMNRNHRANEILEERDLGRSRILVIQLQGHLFFGNMAQLNESISEYLVSRHGSDEQPWIIILDFSLVLGIDSSAAQAIAKIKKLVQKKLDVQLCIFVTGSIDGFPCDYNLSAELMGTTFIDETTLASKLKQTSSLSDFANEETALIAKQSITLLEKENYVGNQVCQSLDLALVIAENALIFRQDPDLLDRELEVSNHNYLAPNQEREVSLRYLCNVCPGEVNIDDVEILFSYFVKQTYTKDEIIWKQGSPGDCAMLLVSGMLMSTLENEAGTSESVNAGAMVGELGLIREFARMSSLRCASEEAVVYRLNRDAFENLIETNAKVARLMDLICVNYLAHRVQHVSNRIFETRCVPI